MASRWKPGYVRPEKRRGKLERRHAEALRLYLAGGVDAEVAAEMGVTRQAVLLWRQRHGLPAHHRRGRRYARWHYTADRLAGEGKRLRQIAVLLGKTYAAVERAILRLRAG